MNVYEIITEKIINRINEAKEKGEPFRWIKPWTGGAPFAVSYTTGKPYRGINRILLEPGEYITYKGLQDYRKTQPEDAFISVKKGSHKMPVFYYGVFEKKDDEGNAILDEYGNQETGRFLRFYQAYNIEDIIGIHSHYPAMKTVKTATEQTKRLERFIKAYCEAEGLTIDTVEDGGRCYYSASDNMIRVPAKEGFTFLYSYYSSVLHELVHSTAKGTGRYVRACFGDDQYSREELVAQIGSQMLLSHFMIADDADDEENDIAYIDGWASRLKENVKEIAKAAAQAEKAIQYFLDTAEKQMNSQADMAA